MNYAKLIARRILDLWKRNAKLRADLQQALGTMARRSVTRQIVFKASNPTSVGMPCCYFDMHATSPRRRRISSLAY